MVLTCEEARQIISAMSGTPQLMAELLQGGGLRLLEGLRLRVQNLDFAMEQLTVHDGKGAKDRYTHVLQQRACGMKSPLDGL